MQSIVAECLDTCILKSLGIILENKSIRLDDFFLLRNGAPIRLERVVCITLTSSFLVASKAL